MRFFLIEDDPATRRMLERIVDSSETGTVIGTAATGDEVTIDDVRGADIVLVDLLMPGRDGIETVRDLRAQGYRGRFVMISQVENKEMVGEAYLSGIDYFIHKPVNRLEVLAVIKRVSDHLSLQESLSTIRRSLSMLDERTGATLRPAQGSSSGNKTFAEQAFDLMTRIGIAGEAGANDLAKMLGFLHSQERNHPAKWRELPALKDLYAAYLQQEQDDLSQEQLQRESKALEQRLRRTVLQALGHLASIGLTDYANPTFEHYAQRLFDFQEVRQRMNEIQKGEKNTKCRLNIKKFITALFAEANASYDG